MLGGMRREAGDFRRGLRRKWDRTPLRVRLTASVLVLVAGSLVLISVAALVALHTYFLSTVDAELKNRLERLKPAEIAQSTESDNSFRPTQYYFFAVYADGRQEMRPNKPDAAPSFTVDDVVDADGRAFTALAADGSVRWRVLALPVDSGGDGTGPAYYALTYKLDHFDQAVAGLVWVIILVGTGVLAGLATLGAGLVRASLSPLRQIETTAAIIAAGDYSRRVPDRDPQTEMGRVGVAINSMLKKIEVSIRDRERSEERALHSEQRMREFIADASHELRTPLTSVRGYAELVRTNPGMPEGDRQYYIGQIEESAKRMGLLVSDLLLLARLDQERPIELRPVELTSILVDAVSAAQVSGADHGFAYEGPDRDVVVAGDRSRLRQVFDNLLGNAVRHTPAGTEVTLAVRLSEDGSSVAVDVRDDGPGMTEEDRRRVFQRFYRTAGPVSQPGQSGGHGLGLAIVAAIVKAHHGSVAVESALGEGACFTVELHVVEPPEAASEGEPEER
ncbi:sensor histidine kinase [Salininema proteolyticum]|uniref:histidine kinase n=1 Tax=Salininema proteolyticum TaxID=1607685 RepID=A0ABV8TYE8_9ACTN